MNKTVLSQQLTLPILVADDETFENFHLAEQCSANVVAYQSLQVGLSRPQAAFFYLWGEKSSGKTHLLKAANNFMLKTHQPSIYIPLSKANHFSPAVLENLENQALVCLDDIHCVIQDPEWEMEIFNLFNRIKDSGNRLLISADCPPQQLVMQLPDLRTRLTWGEVYQLHRLNDEQKIIVLQQAAHKRGLELPTEVATFLLKRQSRDLQHLFSTLDQLDKASLQSQRKLTIPFVKTCLSL
ncbi:DnaA regulatory inactivator Hda [Mergibacter septicus]|uniref:DnaA regulatory inactivator Hda n=1 Tax=Mergibacter septicus TaxID=221402 RepID=UPI0022403512|nr:DnaA regulatory inactivator Hda [Mergibacter septicus]